MQIFEHESTLNSAIAATVCQVKFTLVMNENAHTFRIHSDSMTILAHAALYIDLLCCIYLWAVLCVNATFRE